MRRGWGPIWFWSSVRSIVLLVLAAGAATWVGRRHAVWTVVTPQLTVHGPGLFREHVRFFAADNRFIDQDEDGVLGGEERIAFEHAEGAELLLFDLPA